MQFLRFTTPQTFHSRAWPFLLTREAENNLILGSVSQVLDPAPGSTAAPSAPLLCAAAEDDQLLAVAVRTPPHRLVVSDAPPPALDLLAHGIHRLGERPPGVLGPAPAASAFATAWAALTDQPAHQKLSLRVYQASHVKKPPLATGHFAPAGRHDLRLVEEAMHALFSHSLTQRTVEDFARRRLENGELFVWKAPHAVAVAGCAAPTPHGIRINLVYTPPRHRRHGYASNLVAALSQYLLDIGRKYCYLFTDLSNPTSNHIYQRMGYQPVCDFAEHDFLH